MFEVLKIDDCSKSVYENVGGTDFLIVLLILTIPVIDAFTSKRAN